MEYIDPSWWKWAVVGAGVGFLTARRLFGGVKCTTSGSLQGKTVIITGANTGIGKATAIELAKKQARVILACRDEEKGLAAVRDIRKKTANGELLVKTLDLASLKSVKDFAEDVSKEPRIDILINNAGVFQCPYGTTEDGFEMQMGVNHLGHFYLTNLLLEKLKAQEGCKLIFVSSALAKRGEIDFDNFNSEKMYDKRKAYSNSKLAMNMCARELINKTEGSGLKVYCLHPGMVFTDLGRHVWPRAPFNWLVFPLGWLLIKTPYQGCQTVVHCATAEGLKSGYYGNCKEEAWPPNCLDNGVAKKLWERSEKVTGLA